MLKLDKITPESKNTADVTKPDTRTHLKAGKDESETRSKLATTPLPGSS